MPKRDLRNALPLSELRAHIEDQLDDPGPYSHNIVTLTLRNIDRRFGRAEANKAVRDFDLTARMGIQEMPEEPKP